MLEAYEGRAAVRVKLDNIGSGNVIKAFLWESMEALSQILPAVVEEQNN